MKAGIIPKFVTAKTPDMLRKEMLRVQMTVHRKMHWFNISFDGKNWVAWYEDSYGG